MRVFISYVPEDEPFAAAIRERLGADGFDVWDPERKILAGENWLLKTGRALERADAVVFLLTARSADSPSVVNEVQYVLGQRKFKNHVVPVFVGDAKSAPWILRNLPHLKLPKNVKPERVAEAIAKQFAVVAA